MNKLAYISGLFCWGDVEWPNLQLYELKAALVMGDQMSGEIELY